MCQAFPRQLFIAAKNDRQLQKKVRPKKLRGSEPGHKRPDPEPRYLMFIEFWKYENEDKQVLSV